MKGRMIAIVGLLLALWMSLSHWGFGIGGPLTWWYLPGIGLTYAGVQLGVAHFVRRTREQGRRTSRSTIVSLILSWVSALGFGLTVPNLVDGSLISIVSHLAGSGFSAEMSIALSNPFGILAFTLGIIAIVFAHVDGRDPKPEDDEDYDDDEPRAMVPHPLR